MKGMEEKLECRNVGIRELAVDCNDYLSYVKMGDIYLPGDKQLHNP